MSIILGIESTAHTFGIGIVKDGKILSNVKDMYTTESGGIIPIDSAKHHREIAQKIYERSLVDAKIKETEINAIAFSQGPGLPPCLIEGMNFAKKICEKLNVPLVPVNHCVAHLEIGMCRGAYPQLQNKGATGAKNPVLLYVSGANTQVIAYASGKYRVFGETLDIGVGNFIDNFARYLNLGFPGGPKIEELARKGKKLIELPYKVKGMDVALSGILTNLKQKIESKKYKIKDLAYSMQETVFAMLVETAERALAHVDKKELLLGGGVACNSRLVEMCKIMCKERGAKFFVPSKDLLTDNGSMIAYTGEILYKNGDYINSENINSVDIKPKQRTDQVEIKYK